MDIDFSMYTSGGIHGYFSSTMLNVVKRVSGLPFQLGDQEHIGWLSPGVAVPLPTLILNVTPDVDIQFDGHGYLLCYSAQDGSTI